MDPRLLALAAGQGGVFTTVQARSCGYPPDEIQRLLRRKTWVALRRGVYAEATLVATADAGERHRLDARALCLVLRDPAVLSHTTAAAWHGLELLDPTYPMLHVTRPELHASRDEAGVRHHRGSLPDEQCTVVDGHRVTSLARTAVDVARAERLPAAVAVVDSALRRGVTPEELREVFLSCAHWPGARTAARAVSFGDGRAANPGESLSRLVLAGQGLAPLDLQREIRDGAGLVGVVDFWWVGVVGEYDGKLKYKVPPGADPDEAGEVVWREKQREDRLRACGLQVVRWVYADLFRPAALGMRVRRACELAAGERRSA